MELLGKLFGSPARVKILRLFLLNPLDVFDAKMVAAKSKVREPETKRELTLLKNAGVIGEKSFFKKNGAKSKRVTGCQLKSTFPLLAPLKNLIVSETPLDRNEVGRRLREAGKIKFLATSGVFLGEPEARVDILIVGDDLKKRSIESVLRTIEAEIGKELTYGAMETSDFLYRLGAYDKFVRDVLDFRHDTIIDRLGVE